MLDAQVQESKIRIQSLATPKALIRSKNQDKGATGESENQSSPKFSFLFSLLVFYFYG